MKFYCYILKSKNTGKYYIGSCQDYTIRLAQHNNGNVKSTKKDKPWLIVYLENFPVLKLARRRELQIKRWHSRKAIERLTSGKIVDPRSDDKSDRDQNL